MDTDIESMIEARRPRADHEGTLELLDKISSPDPRLLSWLTTQCQSSCYYVHSSLSGLPHSLGD